MKRTLTILIAAVLMQFAMNAQDLKVISYNIRSSDSKDGTNSWVYRYAASAEMIKDQKADVIALQEARKDQIKFIEENFKDYKSVGENTTVFWNKKTVSMLKSGTVDSATWALIKDKKTGEKFYIVNADLEKTAAADRKAAVNAILDKVAQMNTDSLPVVLTGGLYMKPADPAMAEVEAKMQNARKTAPKTDNVGTYNNWGKNSDILDHICYSGFSECLEYQTVTKRYADRKFVSDHFPIMALLTF
jgi:endonuclease/exonuclease/phosphatase family metal-dependent hydrolase